MTSQTTNSLLETLYVPLDESHSYSYTKLPVLYMHVGCFFFFLFFFASTPVFYSCYCLSLEYSSHCSLPDWLINFHPSASNIPPTLPLPLSPPLHTQTGSLVWTPSFPDRHPVLISITTLYHMVLFSSTQFTGEQMPFQSTWYEQGLDGKWGACVLEAGNTTQASRSVCGV